jgi:hypothetical protein
MKDIFAFRVRVWFNDDVRGVHSVQYGTGATPDQALKEFSDYLQRPAQFRSFGPKNRAQLVGPDGVICELPMINEVSA